MTSSERLKVVTITLAAAASLAACGGGDGDVLRFSRVESPAAPGSMSPHLALTTTGEVVMNWLEPAAEDGHAVRYALLEGDTWSAPATVAADSGWFVNWADFPSVVPITEQIWAAHWLKKRPGGTYAYDIAMSISADGGASWTAPVTPHSDNTPTEHGFVTMFPWSDGIGAVWLDGRNTVPDAAIASQADGARQYGGMTLRFARFAYDGQLLDEGEIDDRVCDCCQTDAAVTRSGPIVVYRDRSAGEIRDISVSRYVEGGWTAPLTVSDDAWNIPACPVNGPTIAAAGEHVAVAWYGAPERQARVKLAWSHDAGATFAPPVVIDDAAVKGRVDVAMLADGAAMITWIGNNEDGLGQLRVRRVGSDGTMGPMHVVAEGVYARNTGFPHMVRSGDRLVFAWPEPGDPKRVLSAVSQPID